MKIVNIIFDGVDENRMVYFYENGDRETKQYPPFDAEDKKIIEEFGGFDYIAKQTYKYNKEMDEYQEKFDAFHDNLNITSTNFTIDSIMQEQLSDEELMKLKLSIFEHEFVKNSKNKKMLTGLRVSKDPIDLIMYFGMLRKDANDKLS